MYPLFLCTNPYVYIYINTSYTYVCTYVYIYLYLYLYIYNVYIYISIQNIPKHAKPQTSPRIAKEQRTASAPSYRWLDGSSTDTCTPPLPPEPALHHPKPPDHPVTRSPGHLRSIFGSQKHQKMGLNYHYFKLRWSKKNIESGFLNHPCLFSLVFHPRFKFCPNIDPDLLAIWQKLRFICCDPSSRNCWG